VSRPRRAQCPCGVVESRARLVDARQFIEAAELLEAPDVIATNAIDAAIAATDAITCHALAQRSADGSHQSAVALLAQVDRQLATTLGRAWERKTQAGYESDDISAIEAASCLRWARQLVEAARARLEP
jgi:hypothetical protein